MKYLYFDNVSGSWDGAYVVANDLVLAKKYLFNCAVSELEGGNDYFDDMKFSKYIHALEEQCKDRNKEFVRPYHDVKEFVEALDNGEITEDEVLNVVVPKIHADVEKYWKAYCNGLEIWFEESEFDEDYSIAKYTDNDDYKVVNEDDIKKYTLKGLSVDTIEDEYQLFRRKYNILDTFTDN